MKYFIDTEFIEGDVSLKFGGFNIPKWLIKPNNTIQLISIALVSSDNREYYAISKDFNLYEAWNRYDLKPDIDNGGMKKVYWIRDNVLYPIWEDWIKLSELNAMYKFNYKNFKKFLNIYGKTNKQIAEEIQQFCLPANGFVRDWYEIKKGKIDTKRDYKYLKEYELNFEKEYENYQNPVFYGYYSAYDFVVLCQLFDKMINLPNGFPKYTLDLKQELDRKVSEMEFTRVKNINDVELVKGSTNLNAFVNLVKGEGIKNGTYPKQINEHNALSDAKWNKELHKFINNLI